MMIAKGKYLKFSQLSFKGNVWRSVWRFCMWIVGLKRDETGFNIFNIACVQTHPSLAKKRHRLYTD